MRILKVCGLALYAGILLCFAYYGLKMCAVILATIK